MGALLTPEILSMLCGSVLGYVMKFMTFRAEERKANFDRMMQAIDKADSSADKAVARVPLDAGKWVRRIIVVSVLFGVILAPFIFAAMHEPVISEILIKQPEYFFGLFGGGTKTVFVELNGYLMIPELRTAFLSIVGFYFGQSAAKGSS